MRKKFLMLMIISLCISALIGITIFLIGDFGELEGKILTTTLAIGGYSLLGLCCSSLYEKSNKNIFSIVGLGVIVLGFLWCLGLIWGMFGGILSQWEATLTFIFVPVSFSHISLMLLIDNENTKVKMTVYATIFFIGALLLMLLNIIWNNNTDPGEFYFRLLGVVAILDMLGTIVSPILNKVVKE